MGNGERREESEEKMRRKLKRNEARTWEKVANLHFSPYSC